MAFSTDTGDLLAKKSDDLGVKGAEVFISTLR
jgi:hypothetical protein